MSKGSEALLKLIQEIFPNQKIELEYNVAEKGSLFVDIFLPRLGIAFEFDGEQHFEYNEHFHKHRDGFISSRRRDSVKDGRCEVLGIKLIRIAYNEALTKELVLKKIEGVMNG